MDVEPCGLQAPQAGSERDCRSFNLKASQFKKVVFGYIKNSDLVLCLRARPVRLFESSLLGYSAFLHCYPDKDIKIKYIFDKSDICDVILSTL